MQSHPEQEILTRNSLAVAATPSGTDSSIASEGEAIQLVRLSLLYLCWQKTLDMLFGLIGLLLLLVLLPFLALLIYLDSPGPIFYHQERVGYHGRKFLMHKFRSMRPDVEKTGQLLWGSAGDRRVTHIGRFMRATHLDELPQVMNIIQGEMSLIGPRPERPEYVVELEKSNPCYRSRVCIKPGLTGWAQVNYGYGHSYQDNLIKLRYDLYYIENRSYKLDLLIIMKTIIEVIRHRGDR